MVTYYIKYGKNTTNLNPKIFKTKIKNLLCDQKCTDCRNKQPRFVKNQEAKELLSNLGITTPLSKIPLLNILF